MNTIQVIPIYRKSDERPTWSEKFVPRPNVVGFKLHFWESMLFPRLREVTMRNQKKERRKSLFPIKMSIIPRRIV
jgi:hypothetical protein